MGIFLKHLCCYMHLRCVTNMREDNSTKTSNTHWRAHTDQPCGPGDMARDTGAWASCGLMEPSGQHCSGSWSVELPGHCRLAQGPPCLHRNDLQRL